MGRKVTKVLGLDYLLGDPSVLTDEAPENAETTVVIPYAYVQKMGKFLGEELSTRHDAAEAVLHVIAGLNMSSGDNVKTLPNGLEFKILDTQELPVPSTLERGRSSTHMIVAAQELRKNSPGEDVVVVTDKADTVTAASWLGLKVERAIPQIYTGRRKLQLSYELSTPWLSNHCITESEFAEYFPDEKPMRANEFVEFEFDGSTGRDNRFELVGRFDVSKRAIVPLKYFKDLPYNLYPRTPGQAMLCEALLAPAYEIPLVISMGIFGTGKTFLTVAAGVGQTDNGQRSVYDQIFICPSDRALGQDIGFLPGDVRDKVRGKAKPIEDNLKEVLKYKGIDKKRNGKTPMEKFGLEVDRFLESNVEFEAIINMGGRSLSDQYIIFDEFQDTERYQARVLLSRIGEGSKLVVMGDPSQHTNPHLSGTNNGLVYAASRLAKNRHTAIVTMLPHEIVRSAAAQAIAECL